MLSDQTLTGFPLDGSYFLNIVCLLVEKSREAVERRYRGESCLEKREDCGAMLL